MPSFGNQMGDDPLGIAVQGRAQQARQQFNQNEGWGHPTFGPLQDPKWAGLFQAMDEQGVDKVAGGNAPRGSHAFVGRPMQIGGAFPTATGQRAPMATQQRLPGYGAPDNRQALNGLHQAFRPNLSVTTAPPSKVYGGH